MVLLPGNQLDQERTGNQTRYIQFFAISDSQVLISETNSDFIQFKLPTPKPEPPKEERKK